MADVDDKSRRIDEAPASMPAYHRRMTQEPVETREAFAVVDVPEQRRFEARLGSRTIGFTQYASRDDMIMLLHTEIDPSVEGQGFGSRLAAGILADVTSRPLSVVVRCPFIAAYVERHADQYPTVEVRR
jgi:predicted GNAT family acetyltransferase